MIWELFAAGRPKAEDRSEMNGIVKYGVISTARIGLNAHIPAIKDSKNGEVAAISSRDPVKAKAEAERLGIPKHHGSYDELIADPDIDAVVNPLPNTMHHEWTIKAANAGKHVMCEKPMAMTVQEAREMHDAAEANGVQLAEAFTHRLTDQMRYVRDCLANGVIGEVTEINGRFGSYLQDVDTNIRANPELGGGSLWDRGSYPLSAIRFVLDAEPVSVFAVRRDSLERDIDSTIVGLFRFPNYVVGTVSSSLEQTMTNRVFVVGSTGTITLTHMFEEDAPVLVEVDGKTEEVLFDGPYRFVTLYEQFSDTILNGAPQEFGRQDSVANTAAITAMLESAKTGRPVEITSML